VEHRHPHARLREGDARERGAESQDGGGGEKNLRALHKDPPCRAALSRAGRPRVWGLRCSSVHYVLWASPRYPSRGALPYRQGVPHETSASSEKAPYPLEPRSSRTAAGAAMIRVQPRARLPVAATGPNSRKTAIDCRNRPSCSRFSDRSSDSQPTAASIGQMQGCGAAPDGDANFALALCQPRRFAYMSRLAERRTSMARSWAGLAGTGRPLPNRARYFPSSAVCRLPAARLAADADYPQPRHGDLAVEGRRWRYCWIRVVRRPARPYRSSEHCQASISSAESAYRLHARSTPVDEFLSGEYTDNIRDAVREEVRKRC
jgi:hypothetical protein